MAFFNRIADVTINGNLASTGSITLNPSTGCSVVGVQVTGTWVGTLVFEGTLDGATWFALNALTPTNSVIVQSATTNGNWLLSTSGCAQVRTRCSVYTSGTITIYMEGSLGSAVVSLGNMLPLGSNTIGRVNLLPLNSGGCAPFKLVSATSTNATSVKASTGQLYGVQAFNLNAAPRYLKLYNKASAPTVGSDVPVKVFMIPGNTAGDGLAINFTGMGVAFALGIALAITSGITDADTGAVAANEIVVNLDYF